MLLRGGCRWSGVGEKKAPRELEALRELEVVAQRKDNVLRFPLLDVRGAKGNGQGRGWNHKVSLAPCTIHPVRDDRRLNSLTGQSAATECQVLKYVDKKRAHKLDYGKLAADLKP